MTIGKRIKARREELHLSQRELSDKMGYSNHSTLGKIERGLVDVTQSKVVKFSEVLGVSVAYLMGWEDEENTAPENGSGLSKAKLDLLDLVEKCSDEEAARLLQMMELFLGKK